jgi:hypothetical protein
MACGFLSLGMIGVAGAASDSYFETVTLNDTMKVECSSGPMLSENADLGSPECSVHRVSTTYGRQVMAFNTRRDRAWD